MGRAARAATAATCLAVTALLTGCGVSGTPTAGEIDVRTLDTGSYPVDRYTYQERAKGSGPVLEGMRMAEAVTPAVRIDPSLTVGRGGIVLPDADTVVEVSHLSGVSRPILENRGFIAGYAASGSDKPDPAGSDAPDPTSTTVTVRLLRFPTEDAAKLAARELEDADFDVAREQNRKLTIAEYPDAFAHWRPGVPNIGMTMPRKEFVIAVFASRPRADEQDLVSWARKTLDAQVPLVDAFEPTPADRVDDLPVDPGRMLARTLVDSRDGHTPNPDDFAVYGPNALVLGAPDQAKRQQLVDDTDLDAMSLTEENVLFRVRDAAAGRNLIDGLIGSLGERWVSGSAPERVPDTTCMRLPRSSSGDGVYRCYVSYKRYVALVNADSETSVQRKASAQYALLANSL